MHGELFGVWRELAHEVWIPLNENEFVPEDFFAELYHEIAVPPKSPTEPQFTPEAFDEVGNLTRAEDLLVEQAYKKALAKFDEERAAYDEAASGPGSIEAFDQLLGTVVINETSAVKMLEKIGALIGDMAIDALLNCYFVLIDKFISKYSLRYDLRRPFSLHPTLPGIFGSLLKDLRKITLQDGHLLTLVNEFEDAVRDLKVDKSAGRIKTCLQKQFNLAEALGKKCPDVTADTLGDICGQLKVWPHPTIRDALRKLYGFRSDYPGLGHAGNPKGVIREVEMRDLLAISILLAGYVPYLCHEMNSEAVYEGI